MDQSKCMECGKQSHFVCSNCKVVTYCSPMCQSNNWDSHSSHCDLIAALLGKRREREDADQEQEQEQREDEDVTMSERGSGKKKTRKGGQAAPQIFRSGARKIARRGAERDDNLVLALDGGGSKGIAMLMALKLIYQKWDNSNKRFLPETHEDTSPVHKAFSLVAGTSAGAIIGGTLALDVTNPETGLRNSIDDLISIFLAQQDSIQQALFQGDRPFEREAGAVRRPRDRMTDDDQDDDVDVENDDEVLDNLSKLRNAIETNKRTKAKRSWITNPLQAVKATANNILPSIINRLGIRGSAVESLTVPYKHDTHTVEEVYKRNFLSTRSTSRLDADFSADRFPQTNTRFFAVSLGVEKTKPIVTIFQNYKRAALDTCAHTLNYRHVHRAFAWESIRSSTAAPSFFAPYSRDEAMKRIFSLDEDQELNNAVQVDGGVGNNNPSLIALSEAVCLWEPKQIKGLITLGCGQLREDLQQKSKFSDYYVGAEGWKGLENSIASGNNFTTGVGLLSLYTLVQDQLMGNLVFGQEASEIVVSMAVRFGIPFIRLDPDTLVELPQLDKFDTETISRFASQVFNLYLRTERTLTEINRARELLGFEKFDVNHVMKLDKQDLYSGITLGKLRYIPESEFNIT